MLLASDERVYVDCNPAAGILLECSRTQIVGRRVDDFTPAEFRDQLPTIWALLLSRGALEGSHALVTAQSRRIAIEYRATANFLPGLHLAILMGASEPGVRSLDAGPVARESLSPREREILGQIAMGASGPEIAAALFISPETVRTHLRNVLGKLGARTRPHAVALALHFGEITAHELRQHVAVDKNRDSARRA